MARETGIHRRQGSRFWWIDVVLPNGRRLRQSSGTEARAEAQALLAKLKAEASALDSGVSSFGGILFLAKVASSGGIDQFRDNAQAATSRSLTLLAAPFAILDFPGLKNSLSDKFDMRSRSPLRSISLTRASR